MSEPVLIVSEDVHDPDAECLEETDVSYWRLAGDRRVTVTCMEPRGHHDMHSGHSDDRSVYCEWPAQR